MLIKCLDTFVGFYRPQLQETFRATAKLIKLAGKNKKQKPIKIKAVQRTHKGRRNSNKQMSEQASERTKENREGRKQSNQTNKQIKEQRNKRKETK